MAKKKASSKVPVKSMSKSRVAAPMPSASKDKGLNLMVQINDPKNVRKDLLEGLREIIIFMQGYEAFRKIQEEKIAVFGQLRDDVKSLNSLVDNKLRRLLPKGKLSGLGRKIAKVEVVEKEEMEEPMPALRPQPKMAKPQPRDKESDELDELESQLRDIEGRLKNM